MPGRYDEQASSKTEWAVRLRRKTEPNAHAVAARLAIADTNFYYGNKTWRSHGLVSQTEKQQQLSPIFTAALCLRAFTTTVPLFLFTLLFRKAWRRHLREQSNALTPLPTVANRKESRSLFWPVRKTGWRLKSSPSAMHSKKAGAWFASSVVVVL